MYPAVSPDIARMMALAALRIAVDQLEIFAESDSSGAESATSAAALIGSVIDDITEDAWIDGQPEHEPDAAEEHDARRLSEWIDQQHPSTPQEATP